MKLGKFLLPLLFLTAAAEDLLQNPDFESPPKNTSTDPTTPFLLLKPINTIPGWTFSGTLQYVTSGPNISLPGNGHAIQLGEDGRINQTFRSNGSVLMDYILTFALAPGGENCSTSTTLNISAPGRSSLFSLQQRYGKEAWESHACYLGRWQGDEPINLLLQSQPTEADPNITCGPVVDKLILKSNPYVTPIGSADNLVVNGDFEVGPAFLSNLPEGVLLNANDDDSQSALQHWSVIGTVKYIDSKHYFVPQGNAAIEIVAGKLAGIQTGVNLQKGSSYKLDFTMGDANDSCAGELVLGARAGQSTQNFTLQTNGTGIAQNFSMKFKADSSVTSISFISFTEGQTKDFGFCGPVIDNVVLRASSGVRMELQRWVLFPCLVFLLAVILINGWSCCSILCLS